MTPERDRPDRIDSSNDLEREAMEIHGIEVPTTSASGTPEAEKDARPRFPGWVTWVILADVAILGLIAALVFAL